MESTFISMTPFTGRIENIRRWMLIKVDQHISDGTSISDRLYHLEVAFRKLLISEEIPFNLSKSSSMDQSQRLSAIEAKIIEWDVISHGQNEKLQHLMKIVNGLSLCYEKDNKGFKPLRMENNVRENISELVDRVHVLNDMMKVPKFSIDIKLSITKSLDVLLSEVRSLQRRIQTRSYHEIGRPFVGLSKKDRDILETQRLLFPYMWNLCNDGFVTENDLQVSSILQELTLCQRIMKNDKLLVLLNKSQSYVPERMIDTIFDCIKEKLHSISFEYTKTPRFNIMEKLWKQTYPPIKLIEFLSAKNWGWLCFLDELKSVLMNQSPDMIKDIKKEMYIPDYVLIH